MSAYNEAIGVLLAIGLRHGSWKEVADLSYAIERTRRLAWNKGDEERLVALEARAFRLLARLSKISGGSAP